MKQGISDLRRIKTFGSSYGSYAALAELALIPDVFAAGVDIVGTSNRVGLLQSISPYWSAGRPM